MSRRAHGEGTLYQDERGRWIGQGPATPDALTGRRRRVKVTGAEGETRSQVAARLRERIAEVEAVGAAPGTVGELVESWLSRAAPKRKSASTMDTTRRLVRSHILSAFASVKVSDVRAETVEAWMDAMAEAGLAKSTIVKVRGILAQVFDHAIRRRHAVWNPARVAELPAVASTAREGRALTGPEARALLNAADHHRLGAWVTVAMTTGMRPGEVSGLEWPAVDFDAGLVVVHQSLAWVGKAPELKSTKTGKSRTLNLAPRTLEVLRRHRAEQAQERLLMGDQWPRKWADLVFVTTSGTPVNPSNLRRTLDAITADSGIEGRVTPYSLRHTATSLLSAAGVAPELLADLLGHVDTRMVFKHYRHPVSPSVSVAADHIDRALEL